MLNFYSASTRIVNTHRGITECMESALGSNTTDCDLVIIHSSLGHDFKVLIKGVQFLATRAKVVAASCFGIVGKEGVSETMKDIAIMAVREKNSVNTGSMKFMGITPMKKQKKIDGRKPMAVFHADCPARGRFLFNRVLKEELVSRMQFPFDSNGNFPPWLGMYGFGEFARLGGKNTYHNYTTALDTIDRKQ